jgi:hypothetical protein
MSAILRAWLFDNFFNSGHRGNALAFSNEYLISLHRDTRRLRQHNDGKRRNERPSRDRSSFEKNRPSAFIIRPNYRGRWRWRSMRVWLIKRDIVGTHWHIASAAVITSSSMRLILINQSLLKSISQSQREPSSRSINLHKITARWLSVELISTRFESKIWFDLDIAR